MTEKVADEEIPEAYAVQEDAEVTDGRVAGFLGEIDEAVAFVVGVLGFGPWVGPASNSWSDCGTHLCTCVVCAISAIRRSGAWLSTPTAS